MRVVLFQNFFFVFRGTHLVDIFLNNMPVKQIWRKSAVWYSAGHKNFFDFFSTFPVEVIRPTKSFFYVKNYLNLSKTFFIGVYQFWSQTFVKKTIFDDFIFKNNFFLRWCCQIVIFAGLTTEPKMFKKVFNVIFMIGWVLPSFGKVFIKFHWYGQKLTYCSKIYTVMVGIRCRLVHEWVKQRWGLFYIRDAKVKQFLTLKAKIRKYVTYSAFLSVPCKVIFWVVPEIFRVWTWKQYQVAYNLYLSSQWSIITSLPKKSIPSAVALLRLVYFFSEQTLQGLIQGFFWIYCQKSKYY